MESKQQVKLNYLKEQLAFAQQASQVLKISVSRAVPVVKTLEKDIKASLTVEQEETLEALTARFSRFADLLIQKLMRAIDAIELVDEGSIIDRLARMEKRGLISDAKRWIEARELRNTIAHEYTVENVRQLQVSALSFSQMILSEFQKIEAHAIKCYH